MKPFDPRGIDTASLTDVGRRRPSNQDVFGGRLVASGARLMIVADGMGGHAGGATASRLAVEAVETALEDSSEAPGEALRAAMEAANARVYEQAANDVSLRGMGTTGVAMLFHPDGTAWLANVGDSRAYRLRDGQFEQLSLDHSLVAEMERRGLITAEEAKHHPRRNEVLRSIGVAPEVSIDISQVELRAGDRYLLCSDGLTGVVSDARIATLLAAPTLTDAARQLVDAANAGGGPDNITVQIARIPRNDLTAWLADRAKEVSPRWRCVAWIVGAALLAASLLWGLAARALRGDF
jgi:protein phosphatase